MTHAHQIDSQHACDRCRRKKIRCDGSQQRDRICSGCTENEVECAYEDVLMRYGVQTARVESMERRLEYLERMLQQMCPEALSDVAQYQGRSQSNSPETYRSLLEGRPDKPFLPLLEDTWSSDLSSSSDGDDYFSPDQELAQAMKISNWANDGEEHRLLPRVFFDISRRASDLRDAINLKDSLIGRPPRSIPTVIRNIASRRPEYWRLPSWESQGLKTGKYDHLTFDFPEPDLLATLVDTYFREMNILYPVLHQPTFQSAIDNRFHLVNEGFARVLLVVCALASRSVDDPRVLLHDAPGHSAGWKWFKQANMTGRTMLVRPTLHDVQVYCLSVPFLQGSSASFASWSFVAVGIRLALDVGAHRRVIYDNGPNLHSELWKRAFWVLICYDREISAAFGRACAIQDEDFDPDLPLELDDERWMTNDEIPHQPSNTPSTMTFFICLIKLHQVISFALRTIYSLNKSRHLLGFVGHSWEGKIVSELNSALNKWENSIPEHLRWDPHQHNDVFFYQSAVLYSAYYQVQMFVHRPFIMARKNSCPLAAPARTICMTAARACSNVLDVYRRRRRGAVPMQIRAAHAAGMTLLLGLLEERRAGCGNATRCRYEQDVQKCIGFLREYEPKWHEAGRLLDMLQLILDNDPPTSNEASLQDNHNDPDLIHSRTSIIPPAQTIGTDHPRTTDIIFGENIDTFPKSGEDGMGFGGGTAEVETSFAYPFVATDRPNSSAWSSELRSGGDQFNTLETVFRLYNGGQGVLPNDSQDLTTGWWSIPFG